jgi:hypothetical protein
MKRAIILAWFTTFATIFLSFLNCISSIESKWNTEMDAASMETKLDAIDNRKGCIVTLAFGHEDKDILKYNESIVKRNRSIRDHLYTLQPKKDGSKVAVADVIIFHEGNILQSHQDFIQLQTPEMPIKFVNISVVFQDFHFVANPLCPPSILSDVKNTPPGYNSMCYFWFAGFQDYVKDYDWMLRFDADCVLGIDVRQNINHIPEKVHFASTSWTNLERSKFDKISEKGEGMVVRGLRNLTIEFANEHKIPGYIKSWKAPYTNVMYVNLKWLRSHSIINDYIKAVIKSGCIYANRWGDLPLWGAAIKIAKEPTIKLKLPYFHGSHNVWIT